MIMYTLKLDLYVIEMQDTRYKSHNVYHPFNLVFNELTSTFSKYEKHHKE